jgi:hypothetical protein
LWIATQGGLVSRDLAWRPSSPAAPFTAAVRRVETLDGALIWGDGHTFAEGPLRSDTKPEVPSPGHKAPLAKPLHLEPNQNAFRVLLAAPSFRGDHLGRTHTVFRTRLEGLDTDWSGWRGQAAREFTNLPYRHFVLQVQARSDDGRESTVATLAFSIAPPWWLTRWALAGYGILGLLSVAGLIRWRTGALHRRAEQLEATVAIRTEELRHSNAELARLHAIERDEKLAARLAEEKARLEVLRYQLNPHFLFNALNSVCASINHAPAAARGMVVRIAEFCRQTLHRPGTEEGVTTLGQELTMLRSYLEIEKTRLGDLLTVDIESEPGVETVRIPPFLLLPLVENAVKYGTATSVDRVGIRLSVRFESRSRDTLPADDPTATEAPRPPEMQTLLIEVANTGEWLEPGHHSTPSTGIGLENLRQRLARYYPNAHALTTQADAGWVTLRVRLLQPMREPAAVSA